MKWKTALTQSDEMTRLFQTIGFPARFIAIIQSLWLVHLSAVAVAQNNQNQHNLLLLPSSRQGLVQMQSFCRLWSQQSLRTTVKSISDQYEIAIWLDRRMDPTQLVHLPQLSQQSTLGEELNRLAASCGSGSGLVENVYLIAPQDRVARIQKAAVVLHGQLSAAGKGIAKTYKTLTWSDITNSNELLDLIRQQWAVSIEGGLPHDLFYAGNLPETTLATQLALLLGGFDLQATINNPAGGKLGGQVTLAIRPLSDSTNWQDNYPRSPSEELMAGFAARYPGSSVQKQPSDRFLVNGPTNLHNEILAIGIGTGRNRNPSASGRQQVYSFSIEAMLPVEAVLENLSKTLQFELEWSEHCTAADRNRLIQLKVESATRRQLLEQVCEQAQLSLEEHKKKVIIHPMEKSNP